MRGSSTRELAPPGPPSASPCVLKIALEGVRHVFAADGEPLLALDGVEPGRRFASVPEYQREWDVEVMIGPQAAPDYLTERDVERLTTEAWKVDANSNRVGLRLEPFGFEWARSGGGIAGGHPSNILDDGYPTGGVNMNGDTAVILGPDGPTSGGFVVVATVVHGAIWKLGQIRPGTDTIRFKPVSLEEAIELDRALDARVAEVRG